MITSVFKKSTPLNLILCVFLMLVFFLIYQFQDLSWTNSAISIIKKAGLFVVLLGSVFITNFVAKKNGLSKDSSYTIFFYFLFLLFLFFIVIIESVEFLWSFTRKHKPSPAKGLNSCLPLSLRFSTDIHTTCQCKIGRYCYHLLRAVIRS